MTVACADKQQQRRQSSFICSPPAPSSEEGGSGDVPVQCDSSEETTVVVLKDDGSSVIASSDDGHGQVFSSRWAYWFAAIGCAVGFGNVWRFPYLCYEFGGVAFLITYIIGLLLVVWPCFTLEMGLAQMTNGGQIKIFASLGKHCNSVGLIAFAAVNICTYYPLLLTWTSVYFVNSLRTELPWTVPPRAAEACARMTIEATCSHVGDGCRWHDASSKCVPDLLYFVGNFFHDECYAWSRLDHQEQLAGMQGISRWNVFMVFLTWTIVFLALSMGTKILGYMMYVTMTLPAIFLFTLVGVGASLSGAGVGIQSYIAKFSGAQIAKPEAWMAALGQGAFSVGVAQGSCAAYARHNDRHQNFLIDAFIVIAADTFFSIVAGFATFSVIGHFADVSGLPMDKLPLAGIALAFQTYPVGLGFLPGALANIFCAIFFVTLWLLGIDTIVGLAEAITVVICDSRLGTRLHFRRWAVIMALCIFYFLLPGLLLSTNLGYFFLDAVDNYSTSVAQAFGAAAEAVAAGWIYLAHHTMKRSGRAAYAIHVTTYLGGAVLLGCLLLTVGTAVALPVGFLIMFGGAGVALLLTKNKDPAGLPLTWLDRLYYMTIFNIEPLRRLFNREACQGSHWRLTPVWSVMVKYAAPAAVFVLFFSTLTDKDSMYSRPDPHAPYPWYIFFVGQLGPAALIFIGTIGFLIYPKLMTPLLPEGQEKEPILAEELVDEVLRSAEQTEEMDVKPMASLETEP